MEKKTFSIPSISCGHCVNAIKTELSELEGVTMVEGDIEGKRIKVEWDTPASEDIIKKKVGRDQLSRCLAFCINLIDLAEPDGLKTVYHKIHPDSHCRR